MIRTRANEDRTRLTDHLAYIKTPPLKGGVFLKTSILLIYEWVYLLVALTTASKDFGSLTASSARILRSRMMLAVFRAAINRL